MAIFAVFKTFLENSLWVLRKLWENFAFHKKFLPYLKKILRNYSIFYLRNFAIFEKFLRFLRNFYDFWRNFWENFSIFIEEILRFLKESFENILPFLRNFWEHFPIYWEIYTIFERKFCDFWEVFASLKEIVRDFSIFWEILLHSFFWGWGGSLPPLPLLPPQFLKSRGGRGVVTPPPTPPAPTQLVAVIFI